MMRKIDRTGGAFSRRSPEKALRRLLGVAVVVLMLCLVFAAPAAAWEADTSWYEENQWAEEYTLYTADELAGFAELVNTDDQFRGKTVKLGADIDLQNQEWTPIGIWDSTSDYPEMFAGVFDGQGHTISNLYISNQSLSYVGLFGWISSGVIISNVTLENVNVTGTGIGSEYSVEVGALAGFVDNMDSDPTLITNCSVIGGTISSFIPNSARATVGGLIGSTGFGPEITNCHAEVTVTGYSEMGGACVGGLVGQHNQDARMSYCSAKCTLVSDGFVGGLVGYTGNRPSSIFASHADSVVLDSPNQFGGIVGEFSSCGDITDCFASVNITAGRLNSVGGIIGTTGWGTGMTNITNCYSVGSFVINDPYAIPHSSENGGLVGSNSYSPVTIWNSAALMQAVDGSVPTGRLAGNENINVVNSYAWGGMKNNGAYFSDGGMNGTSVSASQFWNTQSFFEDTLGWDFENTWKMNSGNSNYLLPVLQFQKTPVAGDVSYLVAPIISISADKAKIDFGTFSNGYTESQIPVTITNTGDATVTLTVGSSVGRYFAIGGSDSWTLNPGESATLIIYLNEGITAGEYSGTFYISTNEDSTVEIILPVSFVVTSSSVTPPVAVWEADTSWWDENPWGNEYTLYTADELAGLAVIANGNSMEGVTIKLGADIDLASQEWTPINFSGSGAVFDGQGHTISNLSIQNQSLSRCGLFGRVGSSVTVSNLTLRDVNVLGDYSVGAIAGSLYDERWYDGRVESPHIINCSVIDGTVEGNEQVGGFIGFASSGSQILHCISNVTVIGDFSVGGFIGDGGGIIHSCTVTSSITGSNAVGGLIGYAGENVQITSSSAVSNVEALGSWTGGLVGRFISGNITDCYAGCILSDNSGVGGIVGDVYHSVNITNCYSSGLISVENSYRLDSGNGGIVGSSGTEGNITITNSVALMQSVDGSSPTGRLTGYADAVIVNSYAWENMTNNGAYFSEGGINGTSVSSSQVWNNQAFFEDTLGWDFENTWKMNAGNANAQLPVLQFQDTPVAGDVSYLTKEVVIPEPTPTPGAEITIITAAELANVLEADVSGNVVTLTKNVITYQPIGLSLDEGEELILTTAGDYTISRGVANYSLFNVYSGTLTLKGKDSANQLTIDGRKDVFTKNTESLVSVWWGGTLNLSENAILTNNSISDRYGRGAGVYVYSDGILHITGGQISNNDILNNGAGGGVFCAGNVVMTSGSISNNTVAGMGGGVEVMTSSSFDMFGGEISNNTARVGGGIDVHGESVSYDSDGVITDIEFGYFNMSGGCIDSNTARSSSGIFNYGIITISGGEICNHADYAVNSGGGNIIITGGTFSNNTHGLAFFSGETGTSVDGEYLYHKSDGKLSISGGAVIPTSETVNLHGNSTIVVTGPLSANAGVYNIWISNDEARVIVNATDAKISGEDLLSHFVLNKEGYTLSADGYSLVLSSSGVDPTPTPTPTPTPEKPEVPTLTPPESLPEDATVTTNTVAETNAATKAEVGYQVNPADVTTMKAPTITRGKLSVQLNEGVKVVKTLSDGKTVEVEATVNEDGSINLPSGALDDAAAVTVNFIGRQFGDVTNDGKPDTLDAARVLQASVGLFDFSGADTFYGDVSGDGFANTLDAARILQYSVSLVDENYVTKA